MNTLPEARASLCTALLAASTDRTARAAARAHRVLRLHDPTVEEAGAYRKSGGKADVHTVCAESLLRLRGMRLPRGTIGRASFGEDVERLLRASAKAKDEWHGRKFGELAHTFSRMIAVHYEDGSGRQPERLEGELRMLLPRLANHLMAELELCAEAEFAQPAKNLCKVSVFDIQARLDMLESHPDAIVRDNARTILCAALNTGNLDLADTLAAGARAKLEELEAHPDAVVEENARSILNAALMRGRLGLADTLVKRAKAKLRRLSRGARIVRANDKSIISAALARGNLGFADTFAAWAKAKFKTLRNHADEAVKINARTIISVSIAKGSTGLADRLADGARKALGELRERLGEHGGADTQLSFMLAAGTLDVDAFLKKGD